MKGKRIVTIICSFLLTAMIVTGCNFFSVSVMNVESEGTNARTRKTSYWSGVSVNKFTIEEGEATDIVFQVNNEKGSVTFQISDSEGNEIYTLTKNEIENTTETFTAESAGTYTLTEKAEKFKGDYVISWGDYNKETDVN